MDKLLFVINVDWYYDLHWRERVESSMTSDYKVELCLTRTNDLFDCGHYSVHDIEIDRSSLNPFSNGKSLLVALRILLRQKFKLIHSVTVKPNLYFGILAYFFSIPIVITIPGLGTTFSSPRIKYKFVRSMIKFMYRLSGKNKKSFFVFENSTDHQLFINEKICYEFNSKVVAGAGVDLNLFEYQIDPVLEKGLVVILFAGRLLHGKGLEDLIEAVSLVNKNKVVVRLDVAGIMDPASSEAIPIELIEEWHRTGMINWLGRVNDMPSLLSEVHIVALPSSYGEGLPRILLEANASGRPVITSNIPGGKDLVQHGVNGLIVEPGDMAQLVEAITSLLSKDQRVHMGQAGRKIVEQNYSKEKVINQYKKIYQTLMKGL